MITYKLQMNRNPSHLADALMFAIPRYLLLIYCIFLTNFTNPINSLFTTGPYDLMVYLIKGLDVDRSAIGHPHACPLTPGH